MWKKRIATQSPLHLFLPAESRPPHAARTTAPLRPRGASVGQAKQPHAAKAMQWNSLPPHAATTGAQRAPSALQAMMAPNAFRDEEGRSFSTVKEVKTYFEELKPDAPLSVFAIWAQIQDDCSDLVSLNVERTWTESRFDTAKLARQFDFADEQNPTPGRRESAAYWKRDFGKLAKLVHLARAGCCDDLAGFVLSRILASGCSCVASIVQDAGTHSFVYVKGSEPDVYLFDIWGTRTPKIAKLTRGHLERHVPKTIHTVTIGGPEDITAPFAGLHLVTPRASQPAGAREQQVLGQRDQR